MSVPLTVFEIQALPALVTVEQVAAALGVSRSHVYREVAADRFLLEPIRIGRVIRFRRADLLDLLGLDRAEVA